MMLQQKTTPRRAQNKKVGGPVVPASRQVDLRSPVENLLRDVAFVLHATELVRKSMQIEQAICSTAS